MKIATFQPEKYRDCNVYYRNFQDHFEYFAVINNELYTAHMSVRPHWLTRILYLIKIEKLPYSQQHLGAIIKQLRRLAQTTIDFILDKKENE